VRYK